MNRDKTADTVFLEAPAISGDELSLFIEKSMERFVGARRVLLVPPDITRLHSRAGEITSVYYKLFSERGAHIDVLPALGTHFPMEDDEKRVMFPGIPFDRFLIHDWRNGVDSLGYVPGEYVAQISEGLQRNDINVQLSRYITRGEYDAVIISGQVVPHEVAGMSSYTKHLFVGCGGADMINSSHFLGAVYGMERIMGRDDTPVRRVFDYADKNFARQLPVYYMLTVIGKNEGEQALKGVYFGTQREVFERAAAKSQRENLDFLKTPIKKAVVFLDPSEYRTTWLGNKAVYRTRMAIADGGELLVIAPGVRRFGEDDENDRLIRKYGYFGRIKTLETTKNSRELEENLSVAAHLIHGSSDGRFSITYAPGNLTRDEIKSVGFEYMPIADALAKYSPDKLRDGVNVMQNGEEIFYISNPGLGLWALEEKFK